MCPEGAARALPIAPTESTWSGAQKELVVGAAPADGISQPGTALLPHRVRSGERNPSGEKGAPLSDADVGGGACGAGCRCGAALEAPCAPSPLELLRGRRRAPGPRRRGGASLRAEAEGPLVAPPGDAGADGGPHGAGVLAPGHRLHGHADERILGAGELEDEGPLPLAVRLRPRPTRGIEAVRRDRQVVVHPAGGGACPASQEPGCCVGADQVACAKRRCL